MELRLLRYKHDHECTKGVLLVDGVFECHTLEDPSRLEKIAGDTCIPTGRFPIQLRDEGGMTQKYKKLFPASHKGMLWLQPVPDFEWVYIHIGNDLDDTLGCILVGNLVAQGRAYVGDSRRAYDKLYRAITAAMDAGEEVYITIEEV